MIPLLLPTTFPWLIPLQPYASLIWLGGVICLWLTRYTHQLGGRSYYALSAVVRPAGVLLISLGWLALYVPWVPRPDPLTALRQGEPVEWLLWGAIVLCFALGAWSVATLGIRRSFLFRRVDDSLVTHGPYALVRHPQFLSAIGITFFWTRLPSPMQSLSPALGANWACFTLALWLLTILEERELMVHFGEAYRAYARRVPRLFPN